MTSRALLASLFVALLAALATLAEAAPAATSTKKSTTKSTARLLTAQTASSTPTCNPAGTAGVDNGILLPLANAKVVTNVPFTVFYCSPTYHSTTSLGWDIIAYSSANPGAGLILAEGVTEQKTNVTIQDSFYNSIGIYERQSGYGGVSMIEQTTASSCAPRCMRKNFAPAASELTRPGFFASYIDSFSAGLSGTIRLDAPQPHCR